jgi:hypothetical protein
MRSGATASIRACAQKTDRSNARASLSPIAPLDVLAPRLSSERGASAFLLRHARCAVTESRVESLSNDELSAQLGETLCAIFSTKMLLLVLCEEREQLTGELRTRKGLPADPSPGAILR